MARRGDVVLSEYASGYIALPLRRRIWTSNLYGEWAKEGWLEELPLPHGVKVVKSRDQLRPNHAAHGEMMFSLDGKPQERSGRVVGAALCYPERSSCARLTITAIDSLLCRYQRGAFSVSSGKGRDIHYSPSWPLHTATTVWGR